MTFINNVLQALLHLYALFVHLARLLIRSCRLRTPPSELPIVASLPAEAGTPKHNLGATTQGVIFWTRLLHGPPISRLSRNVPGRNAATERNSRSQPGQEHPSQDETSVVITICEPTICDNRNGASSSEASPDVSICSAASVSLPLTPSPPSSPFSTPYIIITEPGECVDDPVSRDTGLSFRNNPVSGRPFVFDQTPIPFPSLKRMPPTDFDNSALITKHAGSNIPTLDSTTTLQDPSDEDFIHEFDSGSSGTICDTTADADELEWPLPPGAVFRFRDEKGTRLAIEPPLDTILPLPMSPGALPLHIVKPNVTLISPITLTLSTIKDSSMSCYSPPRIHDTTVQSYAEDRTPDKRSQQLGSILVTFPRKDLIALSQLPNTIVTFESNSSNDDSQSTFQSREGIPEIPDQRGCESERELEEEEFAPEANSTTTSDNVFLPYDRMSANLGPSASDNHEPATQPAILPLQISKSLPQVTPSTHLPSSLASDPSEPSVSVASSEESSRHSKSMEDLIALLDAEFDQKLDDDRLFNMFINCELLNNLGSVQDETEGGEHWSDVLSIESYAV